MSGRAAPGVPPGAPEVLVVDDDRDWAFLVELALGFEGFRVVHASSGDEALAMLKEGEPDAIVLDIGLPDIDGWEVLRRLTGRDRSAEIPVLVTSGWAGGAAVARVAELGGHAYLPKPCHLAELARAVRSLCGMGPEAPSGGPG